MEKPNDLKVVYTWPHRSERKPMPPELAAVYEQWGEKICPLLRKNLERFSGAETQTASEEE